jgi:hypothetical protein
MIKFIWCLLWIIQGLLIAAKCLGLITTSWWGVMMPIILIFGFIVLCFILLLLFAWACEDLLDSQNDYE